MCLGRAVQRTTHSLSECLKGIVSTGTVSEDSVADEAPKVSQKDEAESSSVAKKPVSMEQLIPMVMTALYTTKADQRPRQQRKLVNFVKAAIKNNDEAVALLVIKEIASRNSIVVHDDGRIQYLL